MKASSPTQRAANSTIDIHVDGKQHGHLIVPGASSDSAYGAAQIPVCVIRNGEGPVVSLVAGAHGDDYDGRIALHKLINEIAADDINGCLIIVPTMNPLAAAAGTQNCPSDNQDLNTKFLVDDDASMTSRIAACLHEHILTPASLIIEFQSGGSSTQFTPLAAVHFDTQNKELQQLSEQSMIAFGAPYSARLLPDDEGSLAHSAKVLEKQFLAVRLGGGASSNAICIEAAITGCKNVLVQKSILQQDLVLRSTRMLELASEANFVLAPCNGMLEMCKEPGDEVYMGSPIARIYQAGHTGNAPTVLKADRNGILMARHHRGMIEQGNCVAIVADEVQR